MATVSRSSRQTSHPDLPIFPETADVYHFSAGQFSELVKLSTRQKGDVELGLALMRILWRAGAETGSFDLDEVRRRGRCLLVSSALLDVLHHLGFITPAGSGWASM